MKNADLPAMPTLKFEVRAGLPLHKTDSSGLNKREMFAMHAMQAMLSSKYVADFNAANSDINNDLCAKAVSYADALLEELEK